MEEEKIKGTLIKVVPVKRKITNDISYDSVLLFYRDENGEKKTEFIDRAKVPFYILKDKESEEAYAPPMFIKREKVDRIMVYSDMLYREIALRTDSTSFYDRVISNYPVRLQERNLKNLLKHNYIYDADMDISDRYIKNFNESHEPDVNYSLHKCFYDIEVDLMQNGFADKGYIGFPDEEVAPCPVNIITLVDGRTLEITVFSVVNSKNSLLLNFNKDIDNKITEIKEKLASEYEFTPSNLTITPYETELECIEAFFAKAHEINPDFMLAWNAHFDLLTLYNRLIKLYNRNPSVRASGISGKDKAVMTMSDQKYFLQTDKEGETVYLSPFAYYVCRAEQKIIDRMDYLSVLDGINWFDQMDIFANVRKGDLRESYSLDAIASDELGREKLDYTGYTIKNLAWKNYDRFVLYNIVDVTLLALLEKKNLDMDMVQRLSEITNTRFEKVFKKTIALKNFVCKFAEQQGFVMGNNKNANYGDEGPYFEKMFLNKKNVVESNQEYIDAFSKRENFGAYVADPLLNDYCGVKDASGKRSMFIYKNVFDEDFSSLYPSIIRAYNLDKNTQIGKYFLIDEHIKRKLIDEYGYDGLFSMSKNEEGSSDNDSSVNDLGPTLVDSLESQNWERIGEKYFDLPSVEDMIKELKDK